MFKKFIALAALLLLIGLGYIGVNYTPFPDSKTRDAEASDAAHALLPEQPDVRANALIKYLETVMIKPENTGAVE